MTQSEFEAIAIQLRTVAHGVARQILSSADDAEDAAGDVMLRLWIMPSSRTTTMPSNSPLSSHNVFQSTSSENKRNAFPYLPMPGKDWSRRQGRSRILRSEWSWRKTSGGLSGRWRSCRQENYKCSKCARWNIAPTKR